jgi:hypothetical protein
MISDLGFSISEFFYLGIEMGWRLCPKCSNAGNGTRVRHLFWPARHTRARRGAAEKQVSRFKKDQVAQVFQSLTAHRR